MDKRLADWILDSEQVLGHATPQDRLAAAGALFAHVAMDSSVQGRAIDEVHRKPMRSALAQHLMRATADFFDTYQRASTK